MEDLNWKLSQCPDLYNSNNDGYFIDLVTFLIGTREKFQIG